MASSLGTNLAEATGEKLAKYETIRGKLVGGFPFWDLVVISAADEDQANAFKLQIYDKLSKRQLPDGITYHVFADPQGYKIGNGGSTLAALAELEKLHKEALVNYKVLLIHAGGFSQRLPNATVLGKIFTALPIGDPIYQMLDLKLAMYIDLPSRMNPGVFVTCADDIELYDIRGDELEWSFQQTGFTALAHPSPIEIGTGHGVFVLEEGGDGPHSVKACMSQCSKFLHKPSIERMRHSEAVIGDHGDNDKEMVYTDSAFYMDAGTAKKLATFYHQVQPIQCEVDAYGDFLQALGSNACIDYTNNISNVVDNTDTLIHTRKKIFQLLQGTPLHVLIMRQSRFYHLGTMREYIYHFCCDPVFAEELGITHNAFSVCTGKKSSNDEPTAKVARLSHGSKACILHSVVRSCFDDVQPSVVEYCNFSSQARVNIGSNSIVSMCSVSGKKTVTIPDNTFLHTICVHTDKDPKYVTIVLSIHDNLKQKVCDDKIGDLLFLGKPLSQLFPDFSTSQAKCLFPENRKEFNIWEARLFLVCDTMDAALMAALHLVDLVKQGKKFEDIPTFCQDRFSIPDSVTKKNINCMLVYRESLYKSIMKGK
ncbi:fucose-1-phosphate guanylyltransferase-like [Glandiceps talaboti]